MGNEVNLISEVVCYSGYTYSQRPVGLMFEGQHLEINRIESEWTSPAGKGFKVCTRDGRRFLCDYKEFEDCWQIIPV